MHPGPIVQPGRRPAPPEGPPVAHAPGMVSLPLTPDGQRLAVNGDGAVGGAGDLVSSGEVVVIGRAVGGPGQIEVEAAPAGRGPRRRPRRDLRTPQRARRRRCGTARAAARCRARSGWPSPRPPARYRRAPARRSGPNRLRAGRGRRSTSSTRPPDDSGRAPIGATRPSCRPRARSRRSTTRSTGPRRRADDAARRRGRRRAPPSPVHGRSARWSRNFDHWLGAIVELGAQRPRHDGVLEVEGRDVGQLQDRPRR